MNEGSGPIPPSSGHYAIIGASGLVGSHVLRLLANRPGIDVTAVSRAKAARVEADNIRAVLADAANPDELGAHIAGADYVLICAGILATAPVLAADPVGPVLTNLRITTGALEAAYRVGCKKCVWLSSTTGFPPLEEQLDEDRMFEGDPPESWYGIGWLIRYLETQCRWYAEKIANPMSVTVLRPSMVYGEYDHFDDQTAHFLPSLMRRVINREKPIEVWGNGEQIRDMVYAGDVALAMIAGLQTERAFTTCNIAAGKTHTVNECLAILLRLDGYDEAKVEHLMDKPTSISKRRFSNEKAKQLLGFTPTTDLEDGLRKTLDWYRRNKI